MPLRQFLTQRICSRSLPQRLRPMANWQPVLYPSWIHRDRYVAQVMRWHLEQCLKATPNHTDYLHG